MAADQNKVVLPHASPTHARILSILSGLLVVTVWSTCFVTIRATSTGIPTLTYAAARAGLAATSLMAGCAATGKLRPPRGSWPSLIATGITGTTLAFIGMFSGAERGSAIPSILANSQALFVALFASLFFAERLRPGRVAGLVLGFAGLSLVVGSAGRLSGTAFDALLALGTAIMLALSNIIIKLAVRGIDALTLTAWQFTIGTVPLALLAVAVDGIPSLPSEARWWWGVIYLGFVSSAGGSIVWNQILRHSEITGLTALTMLIPPLSLLFTVLIYNDPVRPLQWVGMVLILAGIIFIEWHGSVTGEIHETS